MQVTYWGLGGYLTLNSLHVVGPLLRTENSPKILTSSCYKDKFKYLLFWSRGESTGPNRGSRKDNQALLKRDCTASVHIKISIYLVLQDNNFSP